MDPEQGQLKQLSAFLISAAHWTYQHTVTKAVFVQIYLSNLMVNIRDIITAGRVFFFHDRIHFLT